MNRDAEEARARRVRARARDAVATARTWSTSRTGFELAHLMGGDDFRISKDFGVGLIVDFSVGRYSKASVSGLTTAAGSSSEPNEGAWHEWRTLGARLTVFP